MPKRRENDPKRTINFEKMGKALGFHSYDTPLGGVNLFSGMDPKESKSVHRLSYNKEGSFSPGQGHVKVLGPRLSPGSELREFPTKPVIEGVAGISKEKK